MPARRDRLARLRHLLLPVEGRDHALERRLRGDVVVLDLAAEMLAQRCDIEGHYSAATARPICSQVGATSDTVARRMSRL